MEEIKQHPEVLVNRLTTRFIGQKIIYYAVLGSTMDEAKKEAQWGAEAGTVILANKQTAGRGRMNRTWISPEGALAFSVILRPNLDYLPLMIMLSSLSIVYGIQSITGLRPQIKWPNDILIEDKKVSGILIENELRKNELKHVIIGVGINVNLKIADYPEIASFATSLSEKYGGIISRQDVFESVLFEMEKLYFSLKNGDLIFKQWEKNMVTIGQQVEVQTLDTVYKGTAESVSRDGSLNLRHKDGSLTKVLAGEVMFH